MLKVERSTSGEEARLTFRGKLTVADTPEVRTLILDTIAEAGSGVILGLAEMASLDSSGVAVLVEGWKRARETGKEYILEDPSPGVMRVLELSQLDGIFHIRRAAT